jgi:uncharacterized membrane protein
MRIHRMIRFTSLLLTGLYAGAAMYSLMGVGPAMKQMQPASYVEFHQKLDLFMGTRMALFAKITLAVNVLLLIITMSRSTKPVIILTLAASLLFFAEIFFTVSVNVPLNEKIQTWDIQRLPAEWMTIRDKWVEYDIIRAICVISSFVIYLVVAMRFQEAGANNKKQDKTGNEL